MQVIGLIVKAIRETAKGWKICWISKSSTKKVSQWGMNWACSSYNWMKKGRKTDIFAATYYLFSLPTTFFSFPKELVNDLERASNIVMLMGFFPRKKRAQTFCSTELVISSIHFKMASFFLLKKQYQRKSYRAYTIGSIRVASDPSLQKTQYPY